MSGVTFPGAARRSGRAKVLLATTSMAAVLTASLPAAADSTWTTTNGNWGDSANWTSATVPNAVGATATFNAVVPNWNYAAVLTGGPYTVGTLNLDSSIANSGYNLQSGTLIMEVSSGSAAINVQSINFAADFATTAILQLNSNTTVTTASSAAHLTVDGLVTGTGALTVAGPGSVVLNHTNTYTGGTNIAAGALRIGASGALGTGDVTFTGSGTLGADATATLANDIVINDGVTATFGAAAGKTLTLDGSLGIGGSAGMKIGSATDTGTVVFAPTSVGFGQLFSNTYEVAGGTLRVGSLAFSTGFLADGVSTTVDSGATLDLNGFNTSVNTLFGGGTITTGGATLNLSGGSNFAGAITGAGALRVFWGTQILTGANTYTGGTTIDTPGTLQLGNGGAGGSILGDVSDNGALIFNRSDSYTFAGTITGTGTVSQNGTGTTILTGTNTYSGGTTIAAGALQLGNGGAGGSILGDVTDNGTLIFNRSDSYTFAGTITGTGTLAQNGAGTTTLTGANTYSGGTTIAAGALRIGAGGALGTGNVTFTGNGTLGADATATLTNKVAINDGVTATFGAAAGQTLTLNTPDFAIGNGSGIKFGSVTDTGTVVFAPAAGTFTGALFTQTFEVVGGTLRGGSSALGGLLDAGASTTINGGATLDINGFNTRVNTLLGSGTVATGGATLGLRGASNFAGAITGTGALDVVSGTTTLSGTNAYTGGTTIDAGAALQLGNGGAGGLIVGDVLDNGLLAFNRSDASTFAGAISGTGSVAQNGTGTTILTGASTYTGGTAINGGTLQLGNGGAGGSIVGDVVDNGLLAFNRSDAYTFAGAISGTGSVAQNGTGITILTGTSAYTGGTTISAGSLQLGDTGNTGKIVGAVVNNAIFEIVNADTTGITSIANNGATSFFNATSAGSAHITNDGGLAFFDTSTAGGAHITNNGGLAFTSTSTAGSASIITNSGGQTYIAESASGGTARFILNGSGLLDISGLTTGGTTVGSIEGDGSVFLGAKDFAVGGNNLSTIFSGVIQDGGFSGGAGGSLTKTGTGTLVLSGTNTYTGATTIDGGVLEVDGAITNSSSVTVNAGGTLTGTGLVDPPNTVTIASGGMLAPGNGTPGTSMTISGDLAFQSGAQYLVQLNPATSSFANVTGTATLGGATVNAVYANGGYVAKQYTILTAASVDGPFGSLVNTNLPSGFTADLSYDKTHAYLDLSLAFIPPPGAGLSGNQQAVGDAIINAFDTNGSVPLVFGGLTAAGLSQLSGEVAAGAVNAGIDSADQFINALD
ncbi:autotransporter-associated beta strand repeat-containing protein, partial [Mesorhizobium sp. dw_380]|uniref:beta strand repeat-containing protein n=1 Tax=Mesorhizobium sp. dw_380 TaxID=2812001 RepID=UPI001BDEBCDD